MFACSYALQSMANFSSLEAPFNPNTWEAEAGGSGGQGQRQLHPELQARGGTNGRRCLKTKN